MDLFKTLNRGIALSGVHALEIKTRRLKQEAHDSYQMEAMETCRQHWLDALLADQTRSWMSISEKDQGVLNGLSALLTAAAIAKAHDDGGKFDAPEISVIRGGLSAISQCGEAGSVIAVADAQAFTSAAERARELLKACTVGAIAEAAFHLHTLGKGVH